MRSMQATTTTSPTTLLAAALLLFTHLTAAVPYPQDDIKDVGYGYLMARACDSYCGADNQFCCAKDEQCYTSAGIAGCGGAGGMWDFVTTTWTETRTYTSTLSSHYAGVTTAAGGGSGEPCVPPEGSGQIACGPICCANWQYCADATSGQCMANAGASSWTEWTTVGVITTQFSAPYRVTSGSTIWASSTGTPPGEADSATATPTETSGAGAEPIGTTNGGLSGGAIAGIVVGTIAGVALLLLCCFCCIVKGLWHSLLALLGLGGGHKKKGHNKERIEVIEEHYSRHGSAHGGRAQHRTWFGGAAGGGGGGGRPSTAGARKEKKSGGGGGLGWVAAGAGALALLLGLKRDSRHKKGGAAAGGAGGRSSSKPPRSDWSSSYYTASYTASSPSSFSDDRRTRNSRRSGRTRTTRASRPSRV